MKNKRKTRLPVALTYPFPATEDQRRRWAVEVQGWMKREGLSYRRASTRLKIPYATLWRWVMEGKRGKVEGYEKVRRGVEGGG